MGLPSFGCLQSSLTAAVLVLCLTRAFWSAVAVFHFIADLCWARACSVRRYIKLLKPDRTNAFGRKAGLWQIFTLLRCISQLWNSCAQTDRIHVVTLFTISVIICTVPSFVMCPLLRCVTKSPPWVAEGARMPFTTDNPTPLDSVDVACGGYIIIDQRFEVGFFSINWAYVACCQKLGRAPLSVAVTHAQRG